MRIQRHLPSAGLALLALCASATLAQTMKPGLWELRQKMRSSSGEMEKAMAQMEQQMASLPPAQRKQMQDMMAKQGVSVSDGGTTAKACMTQEMIDRNETMAPQGDCKITSMARQGNTVKTAYSCTQPKMDGEGQITFASPESYTVKAVVNSFAQGKAEKMQMEGTGKWLSADCGAIKPVVPMPPPAKK